jgi:surfactin synthase thioesterase subunit
VAQTDDAAFLRALEQFEGAPPEIVKAEDLCSIYKKVRPILTAILPFIELIPIWGKKVAAAIRLLMKALDAVCATA